MSGILTIYADQDDERALVWIRSNASYDRVLDQIAIHCDSRDKHLAEWVRNGKSNGERLGVVDMNDLNPNQFGMFVAATQLAYNDIFQNELAQKGEHSAKYVTTVTVLKALLNNHPYLLANHSLEHYIQFGNSTVIAPEWSSHAAWEAILTFVAFKDTSLFDRLKSTYSNAIVDLVSRITYPDTRIFSEACNEAAAWLNALRVGPRRTMCIHTQMALVVIAIKGLVFS